MNTLRPHTTIDIVNKVITQDEAIAVEIAVIATLPLVIIITLVDHSKPT